MLIDLHIHSHLSPCSRLPLRQILTQARSRGLDGVCITDHGGRLALGQVRQGLQADGLLVLVGQEYATPQGDFLIFGDLEPLPADLEAASLLPRVESLGGVAVAAHPFRPGRGLDPELGRLGLVRLAEGLNGRNPAGSDRLARQWAAEHGLGLVGGSDAHSLAELGGVGTLFSRTIACQADLVNALKAGDGHPRRLMAAPRAPLAPRAVGLEASATACM
jgi:predicted metal-dependent phosphoesterase TrpH